MTDSSHDLGKLHIDRDAPPAVRRAFTRNLVLAAAAIALVGGVLLFARRGGAVPVQVVVATATSGGGGALGNASVTANGYVVARTRASVSSKVAGRLAYLGVSEGSFVRRGDIIARLENADYRAAVAQAQAAVAAARADSIESTADRDQMEREAQRLRTIHAQNRELVAQQEVDQAESRAAPRAARAPATAARVDFLEPDTSHAPAAGATAPPRIRVPAAAVRDENGESVVWLVRQGRLERRAVQAGPVSGGFREIRSGLVGGELLLAGGVETPRPGMRVKTATP